MVFSTPSISVHYSFNYMRGVIMFDESNMRVSHVTIVLYNIAKLFISRDCRQLVIWCGQDNLVDKHDHVFMPPPLGAGGIMFSGCPSVHQSVRSLKYPLLTCTWIRWSTRPTETVLQHVRPSGEVSGHLPENAWRKWPEILHADVSWPSSELSSLWPWSIDFSYFGTILT